MSVYSRRVQTLDVIQRNGRIDGETKDASAQEVPKAHGDEVIDGPLVGLDPGCGAREAIVVIGLIADEHQGDDLQRTEGGA